MPDPSGKLPSVTGVLEPWADFSKIPPRILAHAAARGTKVHNACAAIAQGVYPMGLDHETKGYIASFRGWFKSTVSVVVMCEAWLADEELGFGGIPDLVCRINGDNNLTLIDIKTPAIANKLWKPQIAAYKWLLEKNGIQGLKRCCSLQLSKEGRPPKLIEYTSDYRRDLTAFMYALNLWRYLAD